MNGLSYGSNFNSFDLAGLGAPLGYTPNMGTIPVRAQEMPTSGALGFNSRAGGGFTAPIMGQLQAARGVGSMGGTGGGFLSKIGGIEGIGSIAQALGSLGQIYGAIKGVGLAKDQLNFQKEAYNTNLTNTTKAYNTSLEDRVRARSFVEGRPDSYATSYLVQNRM